jgi:hypothetical protein
VVVMGGEVFADAPPTELPGSGRACLWNGRTSVITHYSNTSDLVEACADGWTPVVSQRRARSASAPGEWSLEVSCGEAARKGSGCDPADGYPRAINNVALQSLVAAFAAGKNLVDEAAPLRRQRVVD